MASAKALLGGILGSLVFRKATIAHARELSPHFRWLELEGDALRGVLAQPGDKLQMFLPGVGMRTYSPVAWDPARGTTKLLVYLHGTSPGAVWGRSARAGDGCQFFGPRGSIPLGAMPGPVVLFGDETSFAVAHALRVARGSADEIDAVFEASEREESRAVLDALGLAGAALIERAPGDAHLDAAHEALRAALHKRPTARLVMTGKAQSIQALRARLRAEGLQREGKVKAYWSVGKAGLD